MTAHTSNARTPPCDQATAVVDAYRRRTQTAGGDGRNERRRRNIDAARTAVFGLLGASATLTLSDIADRSGVTERSLYRYYGNIHRAIADAIEIWQSQLLHEFEHHPAIAPTSPLAKRTTQLVHRRIRLDQTFSLIPDDRLLNEFNNALDDEVRAVFINELTTSDDPAGRFLCTMFRLHSIHGFRDLYNNDAHAIAVAITQTTTSILAKPLNATALS